MAFIPFDRDRKTEALVVGSFENCTLLTEHKTAHYPQELVGEPLQHERSEVYHS